MTTATVIEPPTTVVEEEKIGGDAFAAKLAERKESDAKKAAAPVEPETKAAETKEPAKEVKEPAANGKTPLDVPEKKEAAPNDPDIEKLLQAEPPKGASAAAIASHAEMRKGLGKADALIKRLTSELAEARGKTESVPAEYEARVKAAEEAVKEREALLERVAFERSPKFQKFIKSSEDELTSAKSYVEGSEINPNVIDLAAKSVGPKRISILTESGMEPAMIAAVTSHLARADAINRDREAAQENWKTTQAEWTAEQQKDADAKAAQVKAHEDKVFDTVGKQVSEKIEPFQIVEGNEEWNKGVAERMEAAKAVFSGSLPLEKTSEILYKGVAFDVIHEAWHDLRTKYNDLMEETGRIKASRPGAPDGSTDSGKVDIPSDPMKLAGSTFEANRASRGL